MHNSKIWRIAKISYPFLLIIGLTIMILYPQMKSRVYLAGLDSWFHMNQFYDTAMQLKTGHFSYFLSLYGFSGIGRIVNAVYGPGFAYLGGLVLLLTKTWFRFEITQSFLGLTLAGTFFYLLLCNNHVSRLISTLFSLLYMTSVPVLSWVINQEFIGIQAILIPLIILQGTQMIRTKQIHPLTLGVLMAIVFQTHMLTTLTGTIVLIPFFIDAWWRTNQSGKLWGDLIKSVIWTTLLTANVWGAMLNILPQRLIPPMPTGRPTPGGAATFMIPGHYFSTLGFVGSVIMVIFIIIGMIGLLMWHQTSPLYKIITIMGLFFCWLSSAYFPWRLVYKVYPAFVYQIQYPKRFQCVGIALIFLAVGILISNYRHVLNNGRSVIMIVQLLLIVFVGASYGYQKSLFQEVFNQYYSNKVINYGWFYRYYKPTPKLAHRMRVAYHKPNQLKRSIDLVHENVSDYLPTNVTIHTRAQYYKDRVLLDMQNQIYRNLAQLHTHRNVSQHQMTMTWQEPQTKHNAILPVAKYQDTKIMLNRHLLHNPKISRVGMLQVKFLPKGHNQLIVRYQVPLWLKGLMLITIISWLIIIIHELRKMLKINL